MASLRNAGRFISAVIAGAVLALVIVSGAIAQGQSQPKKQVAPAAEQQPATGDAAPPPPPPRWIVSCASVQSGLDCRAGQSISLSQGKNNLRVNVAVQVPPDTKKPNLLIQLPLGVYLPAGVSLQFGSSAAKTLQFQSCGPSGCVTEYPVADAEIAAMLQGANLSISAQTAGKKPFTVQVPVSGFPAAYAKIKGQ
jgi:invasion protein IalB